MNVCNVISYIVLPMRIQKYKKPNAIFFMCLEMNKKPSVFLRIRIVRRKRRMVESK